jgi:hypothetical protein
VNVTNDEPTRGDRIPIVILGGSDRRATELPAEGRDKHPLVGYKGVEIQFEGRPLIEEIMRRLDRSGRFAPIQVAGPARVYRDCIADDSIIDTNGTFGHNIQCSLETVRHAHPGRPVAFITCDVLPEVETLRSLVADFDRHRPCDLWFPMIRTPKDRERLGASRWKPEYRIVPDEGQPAVDILPGHLAIVDPAALRKRFVYRLFQLGYRTRNRSINYRRAVMVRGVLAGLLRQDLLRLLALRVPNLTWTVMSTAIPAARQLRDGTMTRRRLEDVLRILFVRYRHRHKHPERRVALPIVEGLSLALDIDTEEEARERGADLER